MPPSSFKVYVDAPASSPTEQPKPKALPSTRQSSVESTLSSQSSATTLVPMANKENVNPLTGESATLNSGKKRKNGVLSLKSYTPVEIQPESKKMKKSSAAASSSSKSSSASSSSKLRKVSSSSSKKPTRKTSRRAMPKVEEVAEDKANEETVSQLAQSQIDAKCKDLTVAPLADVSEAFETSPVLPAFLKETEGDSPVREKTPFVRDPSTEPALRDCFSPPSEEALAALKTSRSSRERSLEPLALTTPDRRRIYSAFTFKSPSPISKRTVKSDA